jgi:pseudaminic acid synthase
MKIGNREIGSGHKPWICAEIGANHNGSLDRALKLIAVAAECGADAVKFQAYTPDSLTIDSDKPDFLIKEGPWSGRRLYDLYSEAATPREWFPELFRFARWLELTPFASVFAPEDVDFLEQFEPEVYKISSFEIIDLSLIHCVVETNKPLIISTGMATNDEISDAFCHGERPILLHCISAYPAKPSALYRVKILREAWGAYSGLSDHTIGSESAVLATALGACVIEKHLTLSRSDGGPDAGFSSEPAEFAEMVRRVNDAWEAIHGEPDAAQDSHRPLRRSLYAVEDIAAGEEFTSKNIRSIRPGYGLPPSRLQEILVRKSSVNIERGSALKEEMID